MLIKYYKHSSTSQVIIQCKNNVHITENRSCRSFSCWVQYQYHRTFVGRPLISEGVGVSEPWGVTFQGGAHPPPSVAPARGGKRPLHRGKPGTPVSCGTQSPRPSTQHWGQSEEKIPRVRKRVLLVHIIN